MKLYSFLFLVLAFAVGCKEISTSDGRIPQEYIEMAKPYMGNYVGQFEKVPTQLSLSMDGTGYVQLSVDGDLLGAGCDSKIGSLKTVSVSGTKANPKVERVEFNFDSSKCPVLGKELVLEFSPAGVNARILKNIDFKHDTKYPTGDISNEIVHIHLTGEFQKQ